MPMILYTFLENTDLSGKIIVPFNTHGGSGFSDTINTVATLQPEARVERNGFSESRNTVAECAEDVRGWLEELGYLSSFVPVTGIAGVPSEMTAVGSLPLTGDVQPADIVWTVRDAGETGAAIEGNLLTAERAGRVIVRAAIEDGIAPGISFTADFSIAVAAGEASLLGDVNENGRVEIEDVMSACRVLARQTAGVSPTAEEYRLCDLDGSGTVDISDIMGICRILAGAA